MGQQFVMGWDVGGSNTTVNLMIKGRAPEIFVVRGLRYQAEHEARIIKLFEEMDQQLRSRGLDWIDCQAVCAGLFNYSHPRVEGFFNKELTERAFDGQLKLVGDFEIALWGALAQMPDENGRLKGGAVLISGMGSICFGQAADGERRRTGGYGALLDDAGSGFAIGQAILKAIVRAEDGRAKRSQLHDLVLEFWNFASFSELVAHVNSPSYHLKDHAALAPLLDKAAAVGDETALRIADEVAQELVDLAAPVIQDLGLQTSDLGLAGNILLKSSALRPVFDEKMAEAFPALHFYSARRSGAEAALAYALHGIGLSL